MDRITKRASQNGICSYTEPGAIAPTETIINVGADCPTRCEFADQDQGQDHADTLSDENPNTHAVADHVHAAGAQSLHIRSRAF